MIEIKMPKLGESVTEGTLSRWLKQVGEPVYRYEPIAEIITDKVTAELPAEAEGILMRHLVQEGETVAAGTPVALMETFTSGVSRASGSGAGAGSGPAKVPQAAGPESARSRDGRSGVADASGSGLRGRYSPAVRKLAREYNVRLEGIPGTGAGGRVTRRDVLAWLEGATMQSAPRPAGASQGILTGETARAEQTPDDVEMIEASPIRRAIARHMVESVHAAPHAWTMVEADVTGLVRLRDKIKEDFRRREGIPLTFMPFFLKAVAESLREFPILNSSWADDRIIMKKRIHLSVAVATEDALFVPVIRDADRLSITGLAHALHDLATRARQGRLKTQDMEGGTFTVNNTGAFGSVLSKPILNGGQAAILSVEAIVKRPVVMPGDMLAIRSMVNLCLSLDHRVLDGWISGRFLQSVKRRLEAYREDGGI
ncbi:dihydrolipoamide acetyltransferase family protein [Kyrpidia sp.]|uniref:dihydrolipoamide acetyltransferase family protein n=1 Tax=Kyrpidia sp. TaxID=2073077 RepID=UPI002583BEB0|nr:dihydrolipoamide acetyltransferase family protein [Kyrpidia sp.]MCL6575729.1 2-oxo acid dehydrogenase subunit E2 [Kyrpidia sp.]